MSTPSEHWLPRHRLTVDEYYRMAEVGLLAPGARVELIEGEIIDMAPIGTRHASVLDKLNRLMTRAAGELAIVGVQRPIRLGQRTEPQPDLALLKPRTDFYSRGHPTPADVLLVVEVSDTTLRYDRGIKLPLYARHGIPELWIVDLENALLHFFRSPSGDSYTEASSSAQPGMTRLPLAGEVPVDLSDLLVP